jgi:glycosyltransferase involved in cell wall biosynthesis
VYPETRPGYKEQIIKAIHAVDAIHCVSQSIQQKCIDLGAPTETTFVNYNGIDTDFFQPVKKEWWQNRKDQTFRLISVGSLMWRKGIHYQLMVLKALLEQEYPVHLHIVGDGQDKEGLQYQALRLGVHRAITWEGHQTDTQIVQLLQTSDAYISTSAAEGLSNSVVEAAACGLPVLAFDCEGIEEVIQSGFTGFIVNYGNIGELCDATGYLIQNRTDYMCISNATRNYICSNFKDHHWIAKMIDIYKFGLSEKTHSNSRV